MIRNHLSSSSGSGSSLSASQASCSLSPGLPRRYHCAPGQIVLNTNRWRNTELAKQLQKSGHVLFRDDTGVVDAYVAEMVAVIYITEYDLVTQSRDYRRTLAKLKNARQLKGVVVTDRNPITNQYFGAVQKTVQQIGFPLIPVADQEAAAMIVAQLANYYNGLSEVSNPFEVQKQFPPVEVLQLETVLKIPGVGDKYGNILLKEFKSIRGICAASVDQLTPFVGKATAEKIHDFFRS